MNVAGRIVVLDLLRAIAVFGMVIVHVNDRASGGGTVGTAIQSWISALVGTKSAATFAILFGAGFAIFLRQADARRQPVVSQFLRRMFALFVFGLIAEGVFGYPVLIGYAIWGCVLLPIRRWSNTALAALLFGCVLVSPAMYNAGVGSYQWMTAGADAANAVQRERVALAQDANRRLQTGTASTDFREVVATRINHMRWFYQQPAAFLPHRLTYFLIGMLALRLGVWERPREHRKLIVAVMVLGVLAAVVNTWVLPLPWPTLAVPRVQSAFRSGLGLLPGAWLSLFYVGTVLLIAPKFPRIQKLLAPAGQMALTNYMLHIAIIDAATSPYGLGLTITPQQALFVSAMLFTALVVASQLWLTRFRFGPAEWILRCVTYARVQPARRMPTTLPSAQAV